MYNNEPMEDVGPKCRGGEAMQWAFTRSFTVQIVMQKLMVCVNVALSPRYADRMTVHCTMSCGSSL